MIKRAVVTKPQTQRSPWRGVIAPMLLASLGLHGLFLLMPTGVSSEAPIPPPDPEQDSIAITRVPPAGTADPAATSAPGAVAPTASVPAPSPIRPQQSPQAISRTAPAPRQAAPRSQQPQRSAARSPRPTQPPNPQPQPTAPAANPRATAPQSAPSPAPSAPASQPLFNANVGERLLAYVATLDLPQTQIDQAAEFIQDRFAYDASAVTRETFNANQSAWVSKIRQDTGLADLSSEINRTDFLTVYPQRVCLVEAPKALSIGAVVNPDGSWRGQPTLLRSSGYGALDRKALQEIQAHTFPPTDGLTAYVLTVETTVDYGPRPCLDPNTEP
ncbi:MAG: hypothetical protein WBA99_18100 [Nodosilinea sp.]